MHTNQENISQVKSNNDEISLKELISNIKNWIKILKHHWKKIVIITLLGTLSGLYYSYSKKETYKASLSFVLEDDKSSGNLGGALGLASSLGIDIGGSGGAFASSNIIELMKSRLIVEKVLLKPVNISGENINIIEYLIQINKLREKWEKNPALKGINFPTNMDRTEYKLQQDSLLGIIYKELIQKDRLSIQQKDKKVSILTIEVTSEDEKFSKIFCENLASETSNYYIETKSKKARINYEILQKQVDSIRSELNNSIINVASETDNVYNLNPALNIKGAKTKRKQFDVQSNTAILTQLTVQLELAKINLRKETPLIQVIDKPIFPLPKDKITKTIGILIGSILGFFLSLFLIISYQLFVKLIKV